MLASEITTRYCRWYWPPTKKCLQIVTRKIQILNKNMVLPAQFPRRKNCCPAPFSCWRSSRASGHCDSELDQFL